MYCPQQLNFHVSLLYYFILIHTYTNGVEGNQGQKFSYFIVITQSLTMLRQSFDHAIKKGLDALISFVLAGQNSSFQKSSITYVDQSNLKAPDDVVMSSQLINSSFLRSSQPSDRY